MSAQFVFGQMNFFSCNSDGTINALSSFNCKEKAYYGFPTFLDIAITPNKTMYGINGILNKIDYLQSTYTQIGVILDINNRNISGTGLVALNDNFLFTDFNDSLFKIDALTALAYPVGKIGYYCAGDFAFFNDTLYLAASLNHLIQITLNSAKSNILNVKDIGIMNTQSSSVLSLFTTFLTCNNTEKGLFAIDGNKIYLINTQTANATYVCSFPDSINTSYGAASSYEIDDKIIFNNLPNIFTPNSDGINDNFKLLSKINIGDSFMIKILNRWGQIVFESTDSDFIWQGKNQFEENLYDGVYYYVISFTNNCSEKENLKGFVTLIR